MTFLKSQRTRRRAKAFDLNAVLAGQSLADEQFTQNGGDGIAAYEARAATYFEGTVTTSDGASGGSTAKRSNNTSNWWVDDTDGNPDNWTLTGPAWTNFVNAVNTDFDSPTDVNIIHWNQGQGDAEGDTANYDVAQRIIFDAMIELCRNAIILLDPVGVDTNTPNPAGYDAIRGFQLSEIENNGNVRFGVWTINQTLSDTVHFDSPGRILYGQRQADAAAFYLGNREEQGVFGPKVVEATAYADTQDIKLLIDLDGATGFLQAADATNRALHWEVYKNGAAIGVAHAQYNIDANVPEGFVEFHVCAGEFFSDTDAITITWGEGGISGPVANQFPANNATDEKALLPIHRKAVILSTAKASISALAGSDTILDLDAEFVTLNGGRVEEWDDQANNFTVQQATANNRPTYNATGGENSLPVVQCRSVIDAELRWLNSDYRNNAPFTYSFVSAVTGAQGPIAGFQGARALLTGRTTSPVRTDYRRTDAASNVAMFNGDFIDNTKPTFYTVVVHGTDKVSLYVNGSPAAGLLGFDPEPDQANGALDMFIGVNGGDNDFYFANAIDRVLTADEIARMHAFYKDKIGDF